MESKQPSSGFGAYAPLEDQPIFAIGPHTVLQKVFKHSEGYSQPKGECLMKSMS
jgi:hypothetical protein